MADSVDVIVIGGGWAGLAATYSLTQQGLSVTLLEAAKQCGGRARAIQLHGRELDNGQHLLTAAYTATLQLLQQWQQLPQQAYIRQRLQLHLAAEKNHAATVLKMSNLSAPLAMLVAIIRAQNLPVALQWQIVRASATFLVRRFRCSPDQPLLRTLQQAGQGQDAIDRLWQPLSLATLNTSVEIASSALFLRVLRDSFMVTGQSDVVLPHASLTELFVTPAMAAIRTNGGTIATRQRVTAIDYDNSNNQLQVTTATNQWRANHLLIATTPNSAAKLLQSHHSAAGCVARLQQFQYAAITTIYLHYDTVVTMHYPFYGHSYGIIQWIFQRNSGATNSNKTTLAVVISASEQYAHLPKSGLQQQVVAELQQRYPEWPQPSAIDTITEKRATFRSHSGIDAYRNDWNSGLDRVWLAGDYTYNDYPATLEGAVRSGIAIAAKIADNIAIQPLRSR